MCYSLDNNLACAIIINLQDGDWRSFPTAKQCGCYTGQISEEWSNKKNIIEFVLILNKLISKIFRISIKIHINYIIHEFNYSNSKSLISYSIFVSILIQFISLLLCLLFSVVLIRWMHLLYSISPLQTLIIWL